MVQKLNDVIKLRNEELEAKEETIRKLSERLLSEQRISGLVKSQADKVVPLGFLFFKTLFFLSMFVVPNGEIKYLSEC